MELSTFLTFDTLALCVIGAAIAREIWIRMTPALTEEQRDAIAHEADLDRQFDIQFSPPASEGGPIPAKRLTIAQLQSYDAAGIEAERHVA